MMFSQIRVGVPAIARRDDGSWTDWAFQDAQARGQGTLVPPLVVNVYPTCPDKRGVAAPSSYWQVTEQVLNGLISAGVVGKLDDIVMISLHRTRIGNELSMRFDISDGDEPF